MVNELFRNYLTFFFCFLILEKSMRKLLQKMQKQTDANRKDAISHHLEEIEKLKVLFIFLLH